MFNIPNSIYGLAFFTQFAVLSMYSLNYIRLRMCTPYNNNMMNNEIFFFLGMINNYACTATIVVLGIISNIGSVYLSYILYTFEDICIVCVSIYVINIVITLLAIKKFRKLTTEKKTTHEKKRK